MCECTCGDIKQDVVLQIGDATIMVDAYMGCRDCAELIGFDVRAFNPEGRKEWVSREPRDVSPDEYGVIPSASSFEMFSLDDLKEAADEWGKPLDVTEYETISDWLDDVGLQLLQSAFRKCRARERGATGQ